MRIPPREAVVELSRGKAERVAKKHPADLVIGADTVVYCDGKILGKPGTVQEAQKMLSMLSGRKHVVYTGVTVISPNGVHTDTACTEVYFAHMSREEMEQYIATGDCFDKAGGYGIQGYAARFIEKIDGDYFNVVGLPLRLTYRLLKKAGVRM